ncbi:MAG: FAD-dependent oxidoreductase [Caldilineaceae bacterium]
MEQSLLATAQVVIIGGGIVGCSVAYHLAKLGWRDIVLLEQAKLSGGTTWHAAGLVGRLRTSNSMTQINKYSAELYAQLEAETGVPIEWRQCGSFMVAQNQERMTQLRRTAAMAKLFDVHIEVIGPKEIQQLWPLLRTDDLIGGIWSPGDGRLNPGQTALALAQGARNHGVTILEGVEVLNLLQKEGRATGVETALGVIQSEFVVLCGGMWTRRLALRAGVNIPVYPVEHHYIVSEPIEGAHPDLPVGRDPDDTLYFRPEDNAVVLGAFQAYSKPWLVDPIPNNFSFQLLEDDWPKFAEPLKAGNHRIPALATTKFVKFTNGPESFTPDNNFIIGETPELAHCLVAAGFNSAGIACAGGAGKVLAEWIVGGEAPMDLWSVDIRRFTPQQNNRTFLRARVAEVLGLHYQMAWPNREMETARGIRKTPLYDRLAAAGACFGQKLGWERPNWFAPPGVKLETVYSFGRQNWFDYVAAECKATRENVAMFDQSTFAKYLLKGRDAVAVLQRLFANNVDVAPGKVVYTAMLNERGTFESDLTVVRLAQDEFYIITSTGQATRDFEWIRRHIPADAHAELSDVSSAYGVLGVMGPNARTLLSKVTDADLSNAAFPFGTAQTISIGMSEVRAVRITYVGELGWELHTPMECLADVYDTLWVAGHELGLVNAGNYAINALRLEKGYLAWGADLSTDETPLEAGLGFAVAWEKPVDFLGREALRQQQGSKLRKRMAFFVLQDPAAVLWGNEPIWRDGELVGYTSSGAYAYTLGGAIGAGYVKNPAGVEQAFVLSGQYEIETNGHRVPAKVYLRSPYDPKREQILR